MSHLDDFSLTENFSKSCQTIPTPYPHPRLSQHRVLLYSGIGGGCVLKNMFINCLEQLNSKGLQTADKAASPYISYIKYKRLLLLSFMQISTCTYACTCSGTEIHSQQITYSFLKVAVRQKKKKDDMFSDKKWPHYTAAVVTNDNILLRISIALSIHHGLLFWQQLSVHQCFFLLVFSNAGNHYAFNSNHPKCPLVSWSLWHWSLVNKILLDPLLSYRNAVNMSQAIKSGLEQIHQ